MTPLCRHILAAGHTCRQPALHGQLFCRFHHQVKKLTRRYPPNVAFSLPFVFPEDHAAIQLNSFIVLQALTEGRIDVKTAHAMNSLLRTARLSMAQTPLAPSNSKSGIKSGSESGSASADQAVQRVILTPEGEEIAPPREQLEEDEAPPVHGEDCPCRKCAEQFRNAAPEQHHADCRCGLCELETEGTARIADAQKLYDKEPAKAQAEDEDIYAAPSCKKVLREYEARQVAIEAGLIEPFKPEPFGPDHPVSVNLRRHEEIEARIERNKQIGKEIWERRFAHLEANKENQQKPQQSPNNNNEPRMTNS